MIVIKGGRALTPDGWDTVDVAIEGTAVIELGTDLPGSAIIDASGCLVGPGFVDLHTHLREPGQTWKEDITSGSRAGAAGGFTALVAMPNTDPVVDSLDLVAEIRMRSQAVGLLDVIPSAAVTIARRGEALTDLEDLYHAGVRVFTDDGGPVSNPELLLEAMKRLSTMDRAVLSQHAEDTTRTSEGSMHEGDVSRGLGLAGWASEAESDLVSRDLEMVAETGANYHVQHVSSLLTVDLLRAAKDRGLPVTAEVTPHHLALDHAVIDGSDANYKMYPPLRSAADREALVAALLDGTVDIVATDHAPHAKEEKAVPFVDAPRGVIGLETAAAVIWETCRDPDVLFDRLSVAPARIGSIEAHGHPVAPGNTANLVVFDPEGTWTATSFKSKSSNSPFAGRTFQGQVRSTMFEGRVTYRNGEKE